MGDVDLSEWQMWWKRRGGAGVRRLLMEEWDPVGVAGIPEAVDEYDSYVGVVGQKLREGATADQIGAYLADISENHMGLGATAASRERDQAVARQLVTWYREEMQAAERS
jgi:hypothetical protein